MRCTKHVKIESGKVAETIGKKISFNRSRLTHVSCFDVRECSLTAAHIELAMVVY